MNSTKEAKADPLSRSVFSGFIIPLAKSLGPEGRAACLEIGRNSAGNSYFVTSSQTVMQVSEFEFPGGGTADGLIDAYSRFCQTSNHEELLEMLPQLREIAGALQSEMAEASGDVDIMCYTMF